MAKSASFPEYFPREESFSTVLVSERVMAAILAKPLFFERTGPLKPHYTSQIKLDFEKLKFLDKL